MPEKKRRKPAEQVRSAYVKVLMTPAQLEEIKAAAVQEGLSTSSWSLTQMLAGARKGTKDGEPVPTLKE